MIAVSIELADNDIALLLRLAAGNGTTASEMATRLFRDELARQAYRLDAAQTIVTPAKSGSASVSPEAPAPKPGSTSPVDDPFSHLDTSLFALDSDALKRRFARDTADFEIWWSGLPGIVRDGVQRTMKQSAAAAEAGQVSSASGLYIRMRE